MTTACIHCSGWDDVTWDFYEANVAKKEKKCRRKLEKAAARLFSVSSEDSVYMYLDMADVEFLILRTWKWGPAAW